MTPQEIAQLVAATVAQTLAAAGIETEEAEEAKPQTRSGSRKRTRKPAKAASARKPKADRKRRTFTENPAWSGQAPSQRQLNTCARLFADGHISKADYTKAAGDKLVASRVIGKGFAKAGIGQ